MTTDLKLALRTLVRRPLFAIAVVATLAVGLGANATVFSVIDSVLLRSLPWQQPDELVAVYSTVQREQDRADSIERRGLSIPDFLDLRGGTSELVSVAAYSDSAFRLEGQPPRRVTGTITEPAYFETLGVRPFLGGSLAAERSESEETPGIVLSHRLWQERFSGDPQVIGQVVELDGESARVTGVMPAGFRGLVDDTDVWFPLAALSERTWESRGARWLNAVGRLAPGADVDSLNAELEALFSGIASEFADSNLGYSAGASVLRDELVGDVRSPLLVLWFAVAVVLLIAAVNVTNLLLVHLAQRRADFAVSRALGASSSRLLRRISIESLTLAVLGGLCGLGVAFLALRALQPHIPVEIPALLSVRFGTRVLLVVAGLAAALGLLVGAIAAVRTLRRGAQDYFGADLASSRNTRRDAMQSTLLIAEVALATLLTITAGLLVKSFRTLSDVDPGMARSGVGFLRLDPGALESEQRAPQRARILERVRSLSGVESAALATDTPFDGGASATLMSPEQRLPDTALPYNGATRIYRHMVSTDYFTTLGIPLLRGRAFEVQDSLPPDDDSSGPDAPGVAVVTATLAQTVWPDQEAVGQRFYLGRPVNEEADAQRRPWFEVIGVVADHRHRQLVPGPDDPRDPDVFFAIEQFNPAQATVLFKSGIETHALVQQVSRELQALDPELLAYAPATISDRLAQQNARGRFSSLLMTSFAILALALAALGIYGVVAYTVVQRRREIGIRMALGADRSRVMQDVVRGPLLLILVGLVLGVGIAIATRSLVQGQLYQVSSLDVATYGIGAVVLGVVGLAAAALPARRASRIEPVETLRAD